MAPAGGRGSARRKAPPRRAHRGPVPRKRSGNSRPRGVRPTSSRSGDSRRHARVERCRGARRRPVDRARPQTVRTREFDLRGPPARGAGGRPRRRRAGRGPRLSSSSRFVRSAKRKAEIRPPRDRRRGSRGRMRSIHGGNDGPAGLTCRSRATTFTRMLQSAKAATMLNFGRQGRSLPVLTAAGASSNLCRGRPPRLPGGDRTAPSRARILMRRSALPARHSYIAGQIRESVGFSVARGRGDPGIGISERSHQTGSIGLAASRSAGTPIHGEGAIGSRLVRTSGGRSSTSKTVVSLFFVDRVAARNAGASHFMRSVATGVRSMILLTARGGLIHGA